ncbi:DUF4174 domain-containing protein [Mucilaginibacter robiniae]|uniref:DUF4174 domain-containing protein n=1 Tax=Mucilaginibacter robiniae TaxID=2728022 RepID=A0A7L5E404_9SPHI|nr:DUF4174 domain-containing protein [Mucilaginibacter robiniae]QJD98052.1 DUF4174 domain-containing protein [Mucilaginibacter robiniae]
MKVLISTIILLSIHMVSLSPKKRFILLFADNSSNKYLQEQLQILQSDKPSLKERDLEIKTYFASHDQALFNTKSIKANFTFLLIGKDGGEKLRSTKPIALAKLFGTIDAMPMRQDEMKHPHQN